MVKIGKCIDKINEWLGYITSYLVFTIFLVVLFNVIFRYFLKSPFVWANEVNKYMLGILWFIGGGYHVLKREYITVDFIFDKVSKKVQLFLMPISYLIILVSCVCIFYYGMEFALNSIARREVSIAEWGAIVYPLKACVPISGALVLLQFTKEYIQEFYKTYKEAFTKKP